MQSFTHIPFKEYWRPSDDAPPECLYGEVFSSQAMLDADNDLCKSCPESSRDSLKAFIVPLLLYSHLMHLANFGNASSWPVYLFFGNQSKYIQAMPSSFSCHHATYIPKVHDTTSLFWLYNLLMLSQLLDNIQDSYKEHYQMTTTAATLMHCKQELMHAILSLVLNEKFIYVY